MTKIKIKKAGRLRRFFRGSKIVDTRDYQPAVFVAYLAYRGKRYVRIAFMNRIKYQGTIPMTDVPVERVVRIRIFPSPLKKWLYGLVGRVAPCKILKLKSWNETL